MFGCYAQSQIEGFWGVRLGESESSVVNTIKRQFKDAQYENLSTRQFVVRKAKLAGLDVDACYLIFTDGKLHSAKFTKSYSRFTSSESSAQRFIASVQPDVQNDYIAFCEAFNSKYGMPKSQGTTVKWISSNGNSISVKQFSQCKETPVGSTPYFGAMGVEIIYEIGSHLNDF